MTKRPHRPVPVSNEPADDAQPETAPAAEGLSDGPPNELDDKWATMLRARRVDHALTVVEIADDVLGGTPVFKGTRVPLDVVTASLAKGVPFERLKASFDFLTPDLAEAARVYQLVHPRRGRQRGIEEVHPDWEVVENRVVRPPRALVKP
jgi:uncharacterized protein (DUF433 family)